MLNRRATLILLAVLLLAGLTVACSPKMPERSSGSSPSSAETYTPPAAQQSPAPPAAAAPIPTDLHFSRADIEYLNSLDAAARDAAIQRRRENQEALQRASKLTEGYTDSLKKWSTTGATRPVTK
jgi:hypothetical protein